MGRDWVGCRAVLYLPMHLMPFHIDSAEWSCRTKVLACATAYADFGIHHWYAESLTFPYWSALCIYPFAFLVHLERLVNRHHLDSTRRTFACTVTARLAVPKRYAVLLNPHRMTNLYCGLLFYGDRFDSTCRTNLRASSTLWSAEAFLIFHYRLQESVERYIRT